jgi:hypothetical protein
MRGIAYYGTRPDERRGYPVVVPIGHEGLDRDGSPSFIIDSNLAEYLPPNIDGVRLPEPWPNRTTIELKNREFTITDENGDIIRYVEIEE